jgi:hypothetical protein
MDSAPQVQVGGTEDAVRSTQTPVDAEMTPAPSAGNDGQTEQTQDVSLPDAQPTEEPQPPKMLHFLE